MMKYEGVEHYSLVEYIELLTHADGRAPSKWAFASSNSNSLTILINNYIVTTNAQRSQFAAATTFTQYGSPTVTLNPYVEQLWSKLLAKFATWIIYMKDIDKAPTMFDITEPLCEIISVLDDTYDKYATLLGYYAAQRDNLLKGGGRSYIRDLTRNSTGSNTGANEQVVKIKDTPQTDIQPSSDAFNSEVHWTHDSATQSATSSGEDYESYTENVESESVMNRLADIGNKMINIWDLWLKEFEKIFTSPLNIER